MTTAMGTEAYEQHKERMRERSRQLALSGRDIGAIPPVKNPTRKTRALRHYQGFLEEFFPERFPMSWGAHHIKYIERIDKVVRVGGLHAIGMPRGEGKTTIAEIAPIYASVIGAHFYSFLVGNSEPKAIEMLDSIKMELMYNELLLEDFPEVCYPIRCLEGQTRRAVGQLHYGRQTEIKWSPEEIKLPTIPGSPASGATIRVAGITGNIRGAVKTLPDGRRIRPTFVLIDDPQTDESAKSPSQVEHRYRIMTGSILGLAGAGDTIAAIAPMTIIRQDDLADRLLDRKRSPDWTGECTRMVEAFPVNEKLWDQYAELRTESLERFNDIRLATEFYRENREAMDEGARVSWPERYDKRVELSAIQAAMNLKLRDERAFWSEYQNDPMPEIEADATMLSAEEIASKTNGIKRGFVPDDATILVAHIDVQGRALYWALTAFKPDFTGSIVDYGAWPQPRTDYWTLSDIKNGLPEKYPGRSFEGYIYDGLTDLVDYLSREWKIEDGGGGVMVPQQILIDAAWGKSTDTVYKFTRQHAQRAILLPAFGRYIGASSQPMNEYRRKRGERVGHNWRITSATTKSRAIRHAVFDANYWKSFVHSRLSAGLGEAASLSLYDPGKRESHRMISEHLTAEHRFETEGRGRKVDEWKHIDKSRDNHLLDNIVGCHVAASMLGATMPELQAVRPTRRRRRGKFSDIQARKRGDA